MSMNVAIPVTLIPGNSYAHHINPIAKIAWLLSYIVLAFSTSNLVILYGMVVIALLIGFTSGITKPLLKGAAILVPLGGSLLFIQSVAPAVAKPWHAVAELGPFTLYHEGIYSGLTLFGRVACCLLLALCLVMTTHPSDLFTSLTKLKVPYILNFMLAMTLQLIPLFQREVGIIMSAQKSRGMKGTGFSAVLPSFIPVFVGAIERVQQLSISLESRGFGSRGNRTSYRRLSSRPADWIIGIIGVVAAVLLVVVSISRGTWSLSSQLTFSPAFALTLFLCAGAAFVVTIGFALVLALKK